MKKYFCCVVVLLAFLMQSVVPQMPTLKKSQQGIEIPKGQVLKSSTLQRFTPLTPSSQLQPLKSASRVTSVPPPSYETVWSWTFDEADPSAGWFWSGDWSFGIPTAGPVSATQVAGTNLAGSYSPNADEVLISPAIVLPGPDGYNSIVLRFREWFELESGYDFGNIWISTDGGVTFAMINQRTGGSDWRMTEIDLKSYAGQTVKIAFQLTSDYSYEYNGWFIDDLEVLAEPTKILNVDITSLNYSAFPFIYLNVNVDSAGTPLPTLDASAFKVYQDGILQTDYFSVTPPSSGGEVRLADIVFVVDQTGSMSEEIEAVKSNMVNFLNALASSGINYRVGFIIFGDITSTLNSGNLYSDYTDILNTINSISICMIDCGGDYPENSLEAMYQATQMNFRSGAQRIAIMLTDAAAQEANWATSWTVPTVIPVLTANNLTVYPIFDVGMPDQLAQYVPIAQARNSKGAYYHIYDNFNNIINDIGTTIGETYVVRYASSDRRTSGVHHVVQVEVSHAGIIESDTASYMFGAAPIIVRTPETIALSSTSWAEATPFTIRAYVTDYFPPGVSSVTLYYRTTGGGSYTSTPMNFVSDSLYEAVIPSGAVLSPGVDYYLTASDGIDVTTDPREEPGTHPYQIAILPNVAPVITHTPVTVLTPGSPIAITADAFDNTNTLVSMKCFYRKTGDLLYTGVDMELTGGITYSVIIPGEISTEDGVDYYLAATDNFGVTTYHGRPSSPHHIGVATGPAGQTIITGTIFLNGSIAPEGTIVRTYRKVTNALVSSDEVVPFNEGKNFAISILLGDGGVADNDTLVFRILGATHDIPMEFGSPWIRFVNGFPPEIIERDLWFSEPETREIPLVQGYNAISLNVQPADRHIASVFNPLWESKTVQIILEYMNDGISPPEFSYYIPALGIYNPLQKIHAGKGYFVKLYKGSSERTLTVTGMPIFHGMPVSLSPGYNLAAYLPRTPDGVPHAMANLSEGILQSVLTYVNDGLGTPASEYFNVWPYNESFTHMVPGKGYFVQVSGSCVLSYPVPMPPEAPVFAYGLKKNASANAFALPEAIFAYGTNVVNNGTLIKAGSLLQAYDKDGVLCGEATFAADGVVGIAIYRDNPVTEADEGANPNEYVSLTLDGKALPGKILWTEFGDTPLIIDVATTVGSEENMIPTESVLKQNYPNPFNPQTEIQYGISKSAFVQLKIYNALGQEVKTIVNSMQKEGTYRVTWNGKNEMGVNVPSGMYVCRIVAGDFTKSIKMLMIK